MLCYASIFISLIPFSIGASDMTSTLLPSPGHAFPFVFALGLNAASPMACMA